MSSMRQVLYREHRGGRATISFDENVSPEAIGPVFAQAQRAGYRHTVDEYVERDTGRRVVVLSRTGPADDGS